MIKLSDNFTYGKLIKFTIPTIIMMLFTSIYGVVDGLFVSNVAGSDSFAAINLIMPPIMMLGSIGFLFGAGGSAIVSKTLGEKQDEKANQIFSTLIYLLIIIGIVVSILGIIFIKPIARALGAQGKVLQDATVYGTIALISLTGFFLQNAFHSFLVVAQKPKIGLYVSILAGVTNIILDYVLVYKLNLLVAGAALATGIAEILGGLIPFIYFSKKNDSLLHLTKPTFEIKPILKTFTNGSSEMLSHISMSLVNMLYNMQLLKYAGINGVSAYGIIMYINFVFISIFIGYSIGTAPIVGYNYGANEKEKLQNIFKKSMIIISILSVVMVIMAELLAPYLAKIFVGYDEELYNLTVKAIDIFTIAFLMIGFNIFTSAFFTALNNGLISAIISFSRTLVFQVIFILVLPKILGVNGIWYSIIFAEVLSTALCFIFLIVKNKKYGYIKVKS